MRGGLYVILATAKVAYFFTVSLKVLRLQMVIERGKKTLDFV